MVKILCIFEDLLELEAMATIIESLANEMAVDIEVLRYQCIYQAMNDLGMQCDCSATRRYRCPKHFGKEVRLDILLIDNHNTDRYDELWLEDVRRKFSNPAVLNYTADESAAVSRRHGVDDNIVLGDGNDNDVQIVASVRLHLSLIMALHQQPIP